VADAVAAAYSAQKLVHSCTQRLVVLIVRASTKPAAADTTAVSKYLREVSLFAADDATDVAVAIAADICSSAYWYICCLSMQLLLLDRLAILPLRLNACTVLQSYTLPTNHCTRCHILVIAVITVMHCYWQ
jgi:hypothetical protein